MVSAYRQKKYSNPKRVTPAPGRSNLEIIAFLGDRELKEKLEFLLFIITNF